jgi:hypothetical protein
LYGKKKYFFYFFFRSSLRVYPNEDLSTHKSEGLMANPPWKRMVNKAAVPTKLVHRASRHRGWHMLNNQMEMEQREERRDLSVGDCGK